MNVRQSLISQAVLLAGTAAYSIVVAPTLPATVPTHWGVSGKPDAFGPPTFALWFGPGMSAFMMLLTWALPKMSPKKFEIERFESTYGLMMFLVGLLMTAMHVVILTATAGRPIDITKIMMTVIGVFFAIMGNFMGKVRRNFFMGIRTPWTLASERVWEATHRQAGMLWFFGGLALAVLSLIGVPFWLNMVLLLALSFWPIIQSYFIYQRFERS